MKSLLVIQKSSPLSDYIDLFLKRFNEIKLSHVESISSALSELKSGNKFTAVFVGHSLTIDGEAKDLVEALKDYLSNNTEAKMLGTNKGLSQIEQMNYIPSIAPPVKIFECIENVLQLEKVNQLSHYASVPIYCLKYFFISPCDVYLRIGQQGVDATYIKRFKESDPLDAAEVNKYISKNVKEVFIDQERLLEVTEAIANQVVAEDNLKRSGNSFEPVAEALDYASFVLSQLGKAPPQQQLVKKVLKKLTDSFKKNYQGKSYKISNIIKSKDSYFYKHVALTASLVNMLAEELKWEVSEEMRVSIVYAAYFHNFFIQGEEDIACQDEISMNFIRLPERREKVRDHAKLAYEFVKDLKDCPLEAHRFILEHHGSKFGAGFPNGKANSNQLSSLFMLSSEFAVHILTAFEAYPARELSGEVAKAYEKYGKSNTAIVDALKKSLDKIKMNSARV